MHVQKPLRAGALVQIVYVLGDQQEVAGPFAVKPCQRLMSRVRLDRAELFPSCIVEGVNERGIAAVRIRRTDVFDAVAFPKPIRPTESGKAALRRNSSSGQNDDPVQLIVQNHCRLAKSGCTVTFVRANVSGMSDTPSFQCS